MGRAKSRDLRAWLLRVGIDRLALCYPVIAELMRGAHLLEKQDPEKALLISKWVERIQSANFPYPDMNPEVAKTYARMTSVPGLKHMWTIQRGQKSNRLGHDLMISAVAIAHHMPVLTGNHEHFLEIHDQFRLPGIYNPFKREWFLTPEFEVPLPHFDHAEEEQFEMTLPLIHETASGCSPA